MIPVFVLDHAAERCPTMEAVDEAELVCTWPSITEGAVYTFHRVIPHQAVEVDGNEWVIHCQSPDLPVFSLEHNADPAHHDNILSSRPPHR